jgi:hypothetical protein
MLPDQTAGAPITKLNLDFSLKRDYRFCGALCHERGSIGFVRMIALEPQRLANCSRRLALARYEIQIEDSLSTSKAELRSQISAPYAHNGEGSTAGS